MQRFPNPCIAPRDLIKVSEAAKSQLHEAELLDLGVGPDRPLILFLNSLDFWRWEVLLKHLEHSGDGDACRQGWKGRLDQLSERLLL